MSGFTSNTSPTVTDDDRPAVAPISGLSSAEVDVMLRRARKLRSDAIADWASRTLGLWSTVFTGRKHLLPRGFSRWQTVSH